MNCKPGDLAIVINSCFGSNSPNLMKIVEIEKWYGDFEESGIYFKDCWIVKGDIKKIDESAKKAVIPDAWLRPISGLPMEEETEQKLREPA